MLPNSKAAFKPRQVHKSARERNFLWFNRSCCFCLWLHERRERVIFSRCLERRLFSLAQKSFPVACMVRIREERERVRKTRCERQMLMSRWMKICILRCKRGFQSTSYIDKVLKLMMSNFLWLHQKAACLGNFFLICSKSELLKKVLSPARDEILNYQESVPLL